MSKKGQPPPAPKDEFRDTSLRYIGYAHVVACALRPCVSCSMQALANAVTVTYITSDVFSKVSKVNADEKKSHEANAMLGDVLLWHSIATVFVPKLVVSNIRYYTCRALHCRTSKTVTKLVPSVLALVALPLMSKALDDATTQLMDATYRDWMYEKDDKNGKGKNGKDKNGKKK